LLDLSLDDIKLVGKFELQVKKYMPYYGSVRVSTQTLTLDIKDKCYVTEPIVINNKIEISK
jgi:hypothetical protein